MDGGRHGGPDGHHGDGPDSGETEDRLQAGAAGPGRRSEQPRGERPRESRDLGPHQHPGGRGGDQQR